jgi:hypothetical protein
MEMSRCKMCLVFQIRGLSAPQRSKFWKENSNLTRWAWVKAASGAASGRQLRFVPIFFFGGGRGGSDFGDEVFLEVLITLA